MNANKDKKRILNIIKKLKNSHLGDIVINCQFEDLNYQLVLITREGIKDKTIIKLLAFWRKKHQRWFPAQFKVTLKGTKIWLKNKVIEEKDRLLFMIRVDYKYIGHVGLFRFNFKDNTCEIDNIVRGIALYPGIMTNAINCLMNWGRKELFLNGYTLQTASDNKRALKLYQRLNFTDFKRQSLIQVKNKDRLEWIDAPKDYQGEIKRYNVFMRLNFN